MNNTEISTTAEMTLAQHLPGVRKYVVEVLHDNEDRSLYTTIGRLYRMEKNLQKILLEEDISKEEEEMCYLALYTLNIHQASNKLKEIDFDLYEKNILDATKKLNKKFGFGDEIYPKLKEVIVQILPTHEAVLPAAKIVSDVNLMEFAGPKGRDNLKVYYEEMVLRDYELAQSSWYDTLINFISDVSFHTNYGKTHVQPNLEKLVKKLRKEKKEIENRTSLLLKKELNISEEEIKKLRKDIGKVKDRDERGIQTLFRTTSKNHYTLNEMVDRKASIMITVNSIILSLVMGGIIDSGEGMVPELFPVMILSIACILSIFFAIIAIRPLKTQGDFTEEEIRNKQGNLLYFGNFHNMHLRDFEWGFLQMINDKNYLYGSMIRDFYYQGTGLQRKYKFIRMSLSIFIIGLVLAFVNFLLFRFMDCIW